MAKPCMLTLCIEDIGERGGAVTIRAYLSDNREAWFCGVDLDAAVMSVRDLIARELWGKDQPKNTGPLAIVPAPTGGDQ